MNISELVNELDSKISQDLKNLSIDGTFSGTMLSLKMLGIDSLEIIGTPSTKHYASGDYVYALDPDRLFYFVATQIIETGSVITQPPLNQCVYLSDIWQTASLLEGES